LHQDLLGRLLNARAIPRPSTTWTAINTGAGDPKVQRPTQGCGAGPDDMKLAQRGAVKKTSSRPQHISPKSGPVSFAVMHLGTSNIEMSSTNTVFSKNPLWKEQLGESGPKKKHPRESRPGKTEALQKDQERLNLGIDKEKLASTGPVIGEKFGRWKVQDLHGGAACWTAGYETTKDALEDLQSGLILNQERRESLYIHIVNKETKE